MKPTKTKLTVAQTCPLSVPEYCSKMCVLYIVALIFSRVIHMSRVRGNRSMA